MTHLTALTDTFTLANGVTIPIVGFSTAQLGADTTARVQTALAAGYRYLDTAGANDNEAAVAAGLQAAGVPRAEVVLSTTLAATGATGVTQALTASLAALQTDHLDLALLTAGRDAAQTAVSWHALEAALQAGQVRALGIVNFSPAQLQALLQTATVAPMVHQLALTPVTQHPAVVTASRAAHMVIEAYSPFSAGKLLTLRPVRRMAARYERTAAQIVLRWALQHDFLPLPRSTDPTHIKENAQLFDFELSFQNMQVLDQLEGRALK